MSAAYWGAVPTLAVVRLTMVLAALFGVAVGWWALVLAVMCLAGLLGVLLRVEGLATELHDALDKQATGINVVTQKALELRPGDELSDEA